MPQASETLLREWDGPSDRKAIAYLEGRGYVLTRQWTWVVPSMTVPTERDLRAIKFLIDEWDFGGLAE